MDRWFELEEGPEGVEVVEGVFAESGAVTCLIAASKTPGLAFTLTVRSDGILERFEVHGVVDAQRWRQDQEAGVRTPADPMPASGITARGLRLVPLGSLLKAVSYFVESEANLRHDHAREVERPDLLPGVDALYTTGSLIASPVRPGRPGRTDLEYARIAEVYVSRLPSPKAKAETARLLNLSGSTVGGLLVEARRRGLLTSAPDRKVGGQLTRKARDLLSMEGA